MSNKRSKNQVAVRRALRNNPSLAVELQHLVLAEVYEYERQLKEADKTNELLYDQLRKTEVLLKMARDGNVDKEEINNLFESRPHVTEIILTDKRVMTEKQLEKYKGVMNSVLK